MENLPRASEAIEFALTIDDHFEMHDFLDGWMHGDIEEWRADFDLFMEGKRQFDFETAVKLKIAAELAMPYNPSALIQKTADEENDNE